MTAHPARAQSSNETSQILNQLNQLQNQVQTLSRAVYRGDKNAEAALGASASSDTTTAAANFEVRMSEMEEQQRKLTGQLEKINFDIQQLKERLDRMQADNEQRLQQIEHGGSAPQNSAPTLLGPPSATTGGTLGTMPAEGGTDHNGPAEALYEEAFASVRDSKYDQGENQFKQFLSQHPAHPLAANAQYWLGETYYVRGDYKKAAKSFAQGYQDFPRSAKAADSLLKLGLSLSKLDKKDDACLSLRQLQKEFPGETGTLQRRATQEIKQLGCP